MPKISEKTLPKPVAVKAPAKGDHVFLVDGSSYIFRAYHALPPLNRKSDGLQVNAVLGFCNMLWKLLRDVPPEKVVEVQALAGDSSDNVPGVPGIGVKTAAQLIVEYGDLETLLNRAGEIKQPKRREALIENAEKARISRQLVLLDDKVELEVPLAELAVHEPDARKLIAFLKAMEFSSLTRRVAEYAQIDPADIEPDPGFKSGASVFAPPPSGGRPDGEAVGGESSPFDNPGSPAAPTLPLKGGASAPRVTQGRKPDTQPLTPISLAPARAEAARKTRIDRSNYQTV